MDNKFKSATRIHTAKKNTKHLEEVSVQCIANSDGYFGGRIIRDGESFLYTSVLKDGKFPQWCNPIKEYETEFSKLSEEDSTDETEGVSPIETSSSIFGSEIKETEASNLV